MLASKETNALGNGCRVDFGLVRRTNSDGKEKWETVLIEVNDGYVAGRYDGMSVSDYTDMILSRFQSLQDSAVKSLI